MDKVIAVTLGDPAGIGPEVIEKTFSRYRPKGSVAIIGNRKHYGGGDIPVISSPEDITHRGIFFLDVAPGPADREESFGYVKKAVELARENRVQAVVTGPVSKKKWLEHGIRHKGHTGLLAHLAGVTITAMAFWSEQMKVVLYTTHIPLKDIFSRIRKERIVAFGRFVNTELTRLFSRRFPFFFSGLNPHAGEKGHLGDEEIREIYPALDQLAPEMDVRGVFPPDTVFLQAREVADSVVVCWYHDQGLIPFKLKHLHAGVNLTLGLPFVRTSPDHGTAYDIAGQNKADPSSMTEAVKLADFLVNRSR